LPATKILLDGQNSPKFFMLGIIPVAIGGGNKKLMDIDFTGTKARNTRHEADFCPPVAQIFRFSWGKSIINFAARNPIKEKRTFL
jgi:hypothetical protein